MPCDAETLLASAASNGLLCLSDRAVLLAICGSLSAAAGNMTAADALAAGKAFFCYSERQLDEAIAAYLCEIYGL